MSSIHLTKLTMNVSRFHVSCIQEMHYRLHFTCGGLLDFLEHFKHTRRCVNVVRYSANCVRAFQKYQKLCTHSHHSDRSVAAAIFANGTYFVDTPRIFYSSGIIWTPVPLHRSHPTPPLLNGAQSNNVWKSGSIGLQNLFLELKTLKIKGPVHRCT
jgi:hypothetical protein